MSNKYLEVLKAQLEDALQRLKEATSKEAREAAQWNVDYLRAEIEREESDG